MNCKEMKRLTTDTPKGCLEGMLNFAIAKDNKVFLADENGEYNVDLCEYVSKLAKAKGHDFSPEDIMKEGLFEYYQEDFAVLYCLAVQAAELRERLKFYEDKLESKTLIELPCKVGDTVYVIPSLTNFRLNYVNNYPQHNRVCKQIVHSVQSWNKDQYCIWTCDGINLLLPQFFNEMWFLTEQEAEAKLKEMKENDAEAIKVWSRRIDNG